MTDTPRLIEHAFPLKQASLDSVHEKTARHGHISTIHIWPARRPLAACRAALIATLLPDPGTPEKRKELCEKIGGKIVKQSKKKKNANGHTVVREVEATEGGILHWRREIENKASLDWFRAEIRKAYGGRAPKVLDPFSGGGAIPLEAMRLGCDVTAVDINPVAWFILKCTLEYPQKLAGKTHPLPEFILKNEAFMTAFYKAHPNLIGRTKATKKQLSLQGEMLWREHREGNERAPKANLAWHVRAWGQWVLENARRDLAQFYPTYADFEPLEPLAPVPYEKQPMLLVPINAAGVAEEAVLNSEFSAEYLSKKGNPRWVAKPAVAYLWARTVKCKHCGAILPLLKTRWLCKKDNKRVLLTMEPNAEKTGVVFNFERNVPARGGNAAQKREHDKKIGVGTMSRAGAKCPCCPTVMTMEDIRLEGQSGRLGALMTAVAIDGQKGKEYRTPTKEENEAAHSAESHLEPLFKEIPFGLPEEPTPKGGNGASRAFSVAGYGLNQWKKLFTPRQLLGLGILIKHIRRLPEMVSSDTKESTWREAITSYVACGFNRFLDFCNTAVQWKIDVPTINHSLVRFALPIVWDFAEGNVIGKLAGSAELCFDRVCIGMDAFSDWTLSDNAPIILNQSAATSGLRGFDAIVTDPPYYDAIPYSDLMDFFYVWLRRTLFGVVGSFGDVYQLPLSPKWSHEHNDGELIDDSSRFGGDAKKSKQNYEDGMARVFGNCKEMLNTAGRLVIVFANKQPDAWETLVTAIIRAGFVVNGSWPIQTEQQSRMRAINSAALASSVWLVCKKRDETARPGWDSNVLDEMRANVKVMLREFWDAGIRGPDFVWAATGPALEAYSKHPVVKKANDPGQIMNVTEFLNHVRRMVVDFVVGRVLSGEMENEADVSADRLDEPTAYYLLHRHDFGMNEAPVGSCILYAISCGLSDDELSQPWDLISFTSGKKDADDEEEFDPDNDSDPDVEEDSGSKVKLKTWAQRKGSNLGYEAPSGKAIPLIDRVHCLMHLWKDGDLIKVDEYLDSNALRRNELFKRLLQSLIELSTEGSEERSLMESLSNHVQAKGAVKSHGELKYEEEEAQNR